MKTREEIQLIHNVNAPLADLGGYLAGYRQAERDQEDRARRSKFLINPEEIERPVSTWVTITLIAAGVGFFGLATLGACALGHWWIHRP
jgi:hypothetical protein